MYGTHTFSNISIIQYIFETDKTVESVVVALPSKICLNCS